MRCKLIFLICGLVAATLAQAAPAGATAAAPLALLTIADGKVSVLRGRTRFAAAEGQRLEPMDIVQTDASARVARLEFDDRSVLDLGPDTQVLLQPAGDAWPKDRPATAYVAQGWAKLRTPAGAAKAGQTGLASAHLDLATRAGGVVLARIDRQAAFVFVESGRAQLVEHTASREPRHFELGEGHAYSRTDAANIGGEAALRPDPVQLRNTPRALTDNLPLRADQWSRRAEPMLDEPQAVVASEVALWLDTEPALRNLLRGRFFVPARTARPSQAVASAKARVSKPTRVATLAPKRSAAVASTEPRAIEASLHGEEASPAPEAVAAEPVADVPLAQMPPAPPLAVPSARPRGPRASNEAATAARATARGIGDLSTRPPS